MRTRFLPPEAYGAADFATRAAHHHAARALLVRILREHPLLRRLRSEGVRFHVGTPVSEQEAADRFDHLVGRLDLDLDADAARAGTARFLAHFYRGAAPIGSLVLPVRVSLAPTGARGAAPARLRRPGPV